MSNIDFIKKMTQNCKICTIFFSLHAPSHATLRSSSQRRLQISTHNTTHNNINPNDPRYTQNKTTLARRTTFTILSKYEEES